VWLGAAIALFTEGASSPFYAFFVFAVIEVGLRAGFRQTLFVTTVSVLLYLCLIVVSAPEEANFFIMRPVYLAITGYLVGYIGQQRLNLESRLQILAATQQRNQIARDLHDGYAQALAGINLRIARCRELMRRGNTRQVEGDLAELEQSVNREFDGVRAYSRSLAGLPPAVLDLKEVMEPAVNVSIELEGRAILIDHVLQILREGLANACRHAGASSVTLYARTGDDRIALRVEDDGVGFSERDAPWSVSSRVAELGGRVEIGAASGGGLLSVTLPVNGARHG
jgi:signal transduction histidine kinase